MFLTQKHIPRRTLLKGLGVSLALPLLDSMVPAQTPLAKTAAAPKTRFAAVFSPHGVCDYAKWVGRGREQAPGNRSTETA